MVNSIAIEQTGHFVIASDEQLLHKQRCLHGMQKIVLGASIQITQTLDSTSAAILLLAAWDFPSIAIIYFVKSKTCFFNAEISLVNAIYSLRLGG